MLLSIRKSWGIFPMKQKFDTMAAFLCIIKIMKPDQFLPPKLATIV